MVPLHDCDMVLYPVFRKTTDDETNDPDVLSRERNSFQPMRATAPGDFGFYEKLSVTV